ncbi:MAG TPA: hypothetical protein VMF30_07960 [Pirellulales bacterium]|nr:hypothetical protein [Pirellulales bacterium]
MDADTVNNRAIKRPADSFWLRSKLFGAAVSALAALWSGTAALKCLWALTTPVPQAVASKCEDLAYGYGQCSVVAAVVAVALLVSAIRQWLRSSAV